MNSVKFFFSDSGAARRLARGGVAMLAMGIAGAGYAVIAICIAFATPARAQWQPVNFVSNVPVYCMSFNDSSLFLGTEYGVYRSANVGANWRIVLNTDTIPSQGT